MSLQGPLVGSSFMKFALEPRTPAPDTAAMALPRDFLPFFVDLSAHNEKAWFDANRARYEASVKAPFALLLQALEPALAKVTPQLSSTPSPMRINRDIRFSKDKSPYKTHASSMILHRTQKRGPGMLGFFLRVGDECLLGGGVSAPDATGLAAIWAAIVAKPNEWAKVCRDMQGDGLKKVPSAFPADHRFAEDLKRKEFFRLVPFTKKQVLAAEFPKTIEGAMRELEPMLGFFAKALKLPW
jgi:uncharacterized protein (TIGR02453 family)